MNDAKHKDIAIEPDISEALIRDAWLIALGANETGGHVDLRPQLAKVGAGLDTRRQCDCED